ncbi:unnamed protein product [Cercospora beticola]|nr:unnamed protein product [Cercospora beticola]
MIRVGAIALEVTRFPSTYELRVFIETYAPGAWGPLCHIVVFFSTAIQHGLLFGEMLRSMPRKAVVVAAALLERVSGKRYDDVAGRARQLRECRVINRGGRRGQDVRAVSMQRDFYTAPTRNDASGGLASYARAPGPLVLRQQHNPGSM